MLISAAPLIVAHLDPDSINAVIMQLEIEDNSKPTDVKELSVKEYLTVTSYNDFVPSFVFLESQSVFNEDHSKHMQAFYPPVPTPPPNV